MKHQCLQYEHGSEFFCAGGPPVPFMQFEMKEPNQVLSSRAFRRARGMLSNQTRRCVDQLIALMLHQK